jgi:glycosyltransferase involved in cell wall biosynthesis
MPRLAIAIPTFNRPGILRENLESMLPELRETQVPVYISDDSRDGETAEMVAAFTVQHPATHYVRNRPGLGHDLNCLHTLDLPEADYVWYLGDAMRILPGGLNRVLSIIESQAPDFLAVAAVDRKEIGLPTGMYSDPQLVMESLAWHLTMTGSTIYSHRFLENVHANYSHFIGTNFIQLGVLLQSLPASSRGLFWINERWISGHPAKGESYWEKTPFKVFMKDWADFILGLPECYPLDVKQRTVRSHSRETGLLEWKSLKRFHVYGLLGLDDYLAYRPYWKAVTGVSGLRVAALTLIPSSIRLFLRQPRKFFSNK